MTIWFASGNAHKKKELEEILFGNTLSCNIKLMLPCEAALEFNPDETGSTFLENALIKADALHRLLEEKHPFPYASGDPVIADDSGLCVDALGGRPGFFSARYGGKDSSAAEKNALLLKELGDNPQRNARFVCAMVLYYSSDRFYAAQECLEGELVKNIESSRGSLGFGYDPILYLAEPGCTVAELTNEEKNRLSHRGKAGRIISKILLASCGVPVAENSLKKS